MTTKTKTQAKKTAQTARKATTAAKKTSVQAERTVRSLVTDGAYAALGLGDAAVAAAKGLPAQLERLRKEAPKAVGTARGQAEKEFDAYAKRGRNMLQSVRTNAATKRALEQSKVARTQVKAATTSVRRAFGQSVEAAETAAQKIGDETRSA
jgi:hypothetical protein